MRGVPRSARIAVALVAYAMTMGATVAASAARFPHVGARGKATVPCSASMRGIGIPLRTRPTERAGPLGIFEFTPDFRDLPRFGRHLLRTKAPIGVTGDGPVTLAVPKSMRHRVALSYGGRGSRYAAVEFQPCPHKARTAWPGGLVLRDRGRISLRVELPDRPPRRLRIGR